MTRATQVSFLSPCKANEYLYSAEVVPFMTFLSWNCCFVGSYKSFILARNPKGEEGAHFTHATTLYLAGLISPSTLLLRAGAFSVGVDFP